MMVKRLFILCLIPLILSFYSPSIYGYTVDDLRDLLNKQRVDDTFTQEEINIIIEQYEKVERANLSMKLLEMGKEIDIDSELIKEYERLENELIIAKEELSTSFQNGAVIEEVMKKKSRVESIMHSIDSLRDIGMDFEVEYIPNTWTEKYNQVQNMVASLNTQYDIGDVGKDMKLPINYGFYLESVYGLRLNTVTQDSVIMHNGIDLRCTVGTLVMAQWNGIVSNVYDSEIDGKVIEISHGPDLKTYYKHLSEVSVEIGSKVSQYDIIGRSGTCLSNVGKEHLHFEIFLDGEFVNPLFFYGTEGLRAFNEYISLYPSEDWGSEELKGLKNEPDKIVSDENSEEVSSSYTVAKPFNRLEFYENVEKYWTFEEDKKEEEEKKRQYRIDEILGS